MHSDSKSYTASVTGQNAPARSAVCETMKFARRYPALLVSILFAATAAHGQTTYVNPVIPGDHPDPTLTRIGGDYYTSGSSFNPTPRIYHSTDLVHWEVIAQPVAADWSLYGDEPADGIWGGHMVYHGGRYWHFFGRGSGDRAMYFVTADRPEGPWSTPTRMTVPPGVPGFGVDNSIFIDDDDRWFLITKNGRSVNYIVELGADGQAEGAAYDLSWLNPESEGYPYSWAEGPVMWRYDGYYYYSFAQHLAGNQYVMKSAEKDAPLSEDPGAWEAPRIMFEGSKGSFSTPNHSSPAVVTENGTSWVISQSYDKSEWQALGRQGILSEIVYDADGWPVAQYPNGVEEAPDLPSGGIPWTVPRSDKFDSSNVAPNWSFLGFTPQDSYSLTARHGWLRLTPTGGNRLFPGENTVIQNAAERAYSLLTRVDFEPQGTSDEAGLWTFNGPESLQAKLFVTSDGSEGRAVIFSFDETSYSAALAEEGPVWLRVQRDGHDLAGSYSVDGSDWTAVGEAIDVSRMDKEQPREESGYDFNAFTGNQQGLYVQGDVSADFDLYVYRDAYSPILARYPSNYNGVSPSSLGYLAGIHDGDWAMYAGVEFGDASPDGGDDVDYARAPTTLEVVASSATSGGVIEVRLDSLDGEKIAEVSVENTGDWGNYTTVTADVEGVSGQRDVFLLFKGAGSDQLFWIERFQFTAEVTTSIEDERPHVTPSLSQNYPNPFDPDGAGVTTIEYSNPSPGRVMLSVYNLLGQEVATLVDAFKPAGLGTVRFDGDDLPGGVYFYRLGVDEYSVVRTMTLVR